MVAAKEALEDANWNPETPEDKQQTGVAIGSGIGGIEEITDNHKEMMEEGRGYQSIINLNTTRQRYSFDGCDVDLQRLFVSFLVVRYKKISPRFIPKMLINLANGFVSMANGLEVSCHSAQRTTPMHATPHHITTPHHATHHVGQGHRRTTQSHT